MIFHCFIVKNAIKYKIYIGEVFCPNVNDKTDCDLYFEDEFEGYSYRYYKLVPGSRSD